MKRLVFAATALLLIFAVAPTAHADEIDDAVKMFTADDGLTAASRLARYRLTQAQRRTFFLEAVRRQQESSLGPFTEKTGSFTD